MDGTRLRIYDDKPPLRGRAERIDVMTYLLFGGGLYMVLIAIVWLMHPDRGAINYYFAAMYSSTGLIVLYAWGEKTRLIYQAYLLYNMQIPLCYFFAPLLYYGFSQITDLRRKPAAFSIRHFVPAIASAPIVIATNLLNAPVFAGLTADAAPSDLQRYPAFLFVHILGLGSDLYILFFLSRILVNGFRFFRDTALETVQELKLLLLFVGWFFVDILLMMIAHLLKNTDMLHAAKFLSSATFIAYSFYSFRYPEYTQQVMRKAKSIRYMNTQLRGLNTAELLDRLGYLMTQEKIYTDMELSLADLSSKLMVSPHQLSEIINEHLRMNFSSYLNGFRVRDAERLLGARPDATILEIAFEVGFSSKASFNAHFLKQTGLTPSEYRKSRPAQANPARESGKSA
jgi:AraC-like DNA-binding protein